MRNFANGRSVVVTGIGVISPSGLDVPTLWRNVIAGQSAASLLTRFDTSSMPSRLAAQVKDFDASKYVGHKQARRMDVSTQYAVAAAITAVNDAKLPSSLMVDERCGVVEGTTVSGMESVFRGQQVYLKKGYTGLSPFTVINAYCGEGSSKIAHHLHLQGICVTYCSGCASGSDAIGHAAQIIINDEADVMLAGGSDDTLAEPMYGGFVSLGVMTTKNDQPKSAMKPFDRNRDGFVLGEGSVFLVLEETTHALARGARIYAEVAGYGRSSEAYHSTDTHPGGLGFIRSMRAALRNARMDVSEVDYINAHGTATAINDPIETKAIRTVFGNHASKLGISSTKPVTGHLMGASGAIESAICVLSVFEQIMPPTINHIDPSPDCDLDYIPNTARVFPCNVAMNLSAGFGGRNACLLFRRQANPQNALP